MIGGPLHLNELNVDNVDDNPLELNIIENYTIEQLFNQNSNGQMEDILVNEIKENLKEI